MGWPRDRTGFVPYRIDPDTCEVKRFPTFGPPNEHRSELYREVAMHGEWLYAAVGHRPWHLVAFHVETREGRLLATSAADERGRGIRLERMRGGVRAHIRRPAEVRGMEDVSDAALDFWLHEGEIHRREGEIPPWSDGPAERDRSGTFRWAREYQRWGDFEPRSPPPEFERDAGDPDPDGHVELPYRLPGEEDWRVLEYDVRMYPGVVRRLVEVNDHVLFATDEGYGQHVFYDLETRKVMRVGGTLSPYSIGSYGDRLYVSGYPSSQMYEYDFARPVGLRQEAPNPRRVGYIAEKSDTHCPLAGTVAGADGRVYCAGTTYGRRREGGGFGWYAPATGELGGRPFEGHRIFWMTAAADRRYILLSSKLGSEGELFGWDTEKASFVYEKQLLGGGRPGPLEEVLPNGLVIGHHGSGVLYGLRADTGEVLWKKPVPAPPITAFSRVRRHAYTFRRGPNGYLWCFLGDVLVRVDPRDARVEILGRMNPAQLAFAAGAVYSAGGGKLRRLELPVGGSK